MIHRNRQIWKTVTNFCAVFVSAVIVSAQMSYGQSTPGNIGAFYAAIYSQTEFQELADDDVTTSFWRPSSKPEEFRLLGPVREFRQPPHVEGEKKFLATVIQVELVNILVWSYSRFISPQDWTLVSIDTWKKNLERGWVYDDNRFADNQIFHPIHGNLYYNAARSNGYSYWESMPFVFFGSWTWEYFGETHPAAPNDWMNTSLGGIALGEMTFRAATLIVDNTATGASRTWSEIAGGLINPVRGLNRVAKGETSRVYENDEDFQPDVLQTTITFGSRSSAGDDVFGDVFTAAFTSYDIDYGDEWEDEIDSPYDAFDLDVQLNFKDSNVLGRVSVAGALLSGDLHESGKRVGSFKLLQYFDFFSNQFIEHSVHGIGAVYYSRWNLGKQRRIRAALHVIGIPFGATGSEYADLGGRTYDYGSGGGARVELFYDVNYFEYVRLLYRADYLSTVNGAEGEHLIQIASAEVAVPIWRRAGIGVAYRFLNRNSWFDRFPDVQKQNTQFIISARWRFGTQ